MSKLYSDLLRKKTDRKKKRQSKIGKKHFPSAFNLAKPDYFKSKEDLETNLPVTENTDEIKLADKGKGKSETLNKWKEASEKLTETQIKLFGLEEVYKHYRTHKANQENPLLSNIEVDLASRNRIEDSNKAFELELNKLLIKSGFKGGVTEFEELVNTFVIQFRTATFYSACEYLALYNNLLKAEYKRYTKEAETEELFKQLSDYRKTYSEFRNEADYYNAAQKSPDGQKHTKSVTDAGKKASKLKNLAQSQILILSKDYPVFREELASKDSKLDKEALANVDSKEELAALLKKHIVKRLKDVDDTRKYLDEKPDLVFKLDNLLKMSMMQRGLKAGEIGYEIVQDKIKDLESFEGSKNLMLGLFSVVLAIFSRGTIVPALGATALNTILAYDVIEDYSEQKAAAGAGLASQDPSFVWVTLAISSLGLDRWMLKTTLTKIAKLGFKEGGDIVRFRKGLADLRIKKEITKEVEMAVSEAAINREAAHEALENVKEVIITKGHGAFADKQMYNLLLRYAYYTKNSGINTFQKYYGNIKKALIDARLNRDLLPEELDKLKKAFLEGRSFKSDVDLMNFMSGAENFIDDVFRSITSVKNFESLGGFSLKQISEHDLGILKRIKTTNKIDQNWNVVSAKVTNINKKIDKTSYQSHAHFDNFNSKIPGGSPSVKESERIFSTSEAETIKGKKIPRGNDAEVKILEEIARFLGAKPGDLKTKKFLEITGKISIYSELTPCGSCSNVIKQFKQLFPYIEIEIYAQPKISF